MRRKRWYKRFFWRVGGLLFLILLFGFLFDFDIRLKEKIDRENWKEEFRQIKDKIYAEATKHNPKGDFWPDWVDDFLQGELKKKWNEWFVDK